MTTFDRLSVGDYEVEDCGEDNSQYFTGRGVAYTEWDEAFVGVGDNAIEAFEDACEQAAQFGYSTENIDAPDYLDNTSAHAECDEDEGEHDWQHYVALYVRRAVN